MTSGKPFSTHDSAEIDLAVLWQAILDHRYFIALVALLCAGAAAVYALIATPIYRAEVVVTEVTDNQTGGLASLASQFGGLASLAGINLSSGSSGREARAVLESRRLVEEFIQRENLLPKLYPDDSEPPSLWFAVKRFRDTVLSIREDPRTGLTLISVDWTDPALATQWANDFVALANEMIRTRDSEDAQRNITYLEEQATQTNVVELRSVLYKLIENEAKTLMLANGRMEYAFTIVDPAVPPEMRISPRRTLMVLAGVLLGSVLGVLLAFSHSMLRRRGRSAVVAA